MKKDLRFFLHRTLFALLFLVVAVPGNSLVFADTFQPYSEETVPQNVETLWADYDPGKEPLDTEVVREWREDGIVCRYVIYTACTIKGEPCRVAALYTFPEGAENAPAFVWAHGGGQRAERQRGEYFAKNGFATIDINWGGREIVEGIEENTDWGKVDPSQGPRFYPGALREQTKLNLDPDEHTIDPVPGPRNGNWFLLAVAGRRAITFLEQQTEVDPDKIGFTGYSMGGVITSMVAIDPRLKAVVPMVGGTGHLTDDFPGIPDSSNIRQYRHPELFTATIDSKSYWPHVKCPVLFLNATNDFHAPFERVFQCVDLLPHDNWRVSHKMHYNHSLGPEQWILMNLWFNHYLKGEKTEIAPTPESQIKLDPSGSSATFSVEPKGAVEPSSVRIYYSHDPNPRARFWKSASAEEEDGKWTTRLPVRETLPLFAFANVSYALAKSQEAFQGTAGKYSINSKEKVLLPGTIEIERLRENAKHSPVFSDFSKDRKDWGDGHGGSLKTYRFQDPDVAVPPADAILKWTVDAPRPGLSYRLRIERNRWLTGNKDPDGNFSFSQNIKEPGKTVLELRVSDFKDSEGEPMPGWENISGLTVSVYDGAAKQSVEFFREENLAMLGRMEWILPAEK